MGAIARELTGRTGDTNPDGSRGQISRPWAAYGVSTVAEAVSTVAASAPSLVNGLVLQNIAVQEEIENGWECSAEYGVFAPKPPPKVGESSFNFEVGTQPVRVVIPLSSQTVYTRPGDTAPADSARWLIGQQGDGSAPEGVEVFEPNATFSETHYLSGVTISTAYQRSVLRVVGKINASPFRGWAAEEVLCSGVSGSKRGADDWEITFRFTIREHQEGLTLAGISGIDKKGWQFVWPRFEVKKDEDAKILSNVVKYMVVADVMQAASFSPLGIGI